MLGGRGLRPVPTEDLKTLLSAVHGQKVAFPLTRRWLLEMGMNRLAESADVLLGLEEAGVRAVLVAVIAERQRTE